MKIVILGYMACGKTFTANKLANYLDVEHLDLDTYIEEKENLSITKIFKLKGEIYFRKVESTYLKEILKSHKKFILSVGGGTPCYGDNMKLIKDYSTSFYLKATPSVLYTHLVEGKQNRPLVKLFNDDELEEFIAKHLLERNFYYLQADYFIEVDMFNKTSTEVINEIVNCIIQ